MPPPLSVPWPAGTLNARLVEGDKRVLEVAALPNGALAELFSLAESTEAASVRVGRFDLPGRAQGLWESGFETDGSAAVWQRDNTARRTEVHRALGFLERAAPHLFMAEAQHACFDRIDFEGPHSASIFPVFGGGVALEISAADLSFTDASTLLRELAHSDRIEGQLVLRTERGLSAGVRDLVALKTAQVFGQAQAPLPSGPDEVCWEHQFHGRSWKLRFGTVDGERGPVLSVGPIVKGLDDCLVGMVGELAVALGLRSVEASTAPDANGIAHKFVSRLARKPAAGSWSAQARQVLGHDQAHFYVQADDRTLRLAGNGWTATVREVTTGHGPVEHRLDGVFDGSPEAWGRLTECADRLKPEAFVGRVDYAAVVHRLRTKGNPPVKLLSFLSGPRRPSVRVWGSSDPKVLEHLEAAKDDFDAFVGPDHASALTDVYVWDWLGGGARGTHHWKYGGWGGCGDGSILVRPDAPKTLIWHEAGHNLQVRRYGRLELTPRAGKGPSQSEVEHLRSVGYPPEAHIYEHQANCLSDLVGNLAAVMRDPVKWLYEHDRGLAFRQILRDLRGLSVPDEPDPLGIGLLLELAFPTVSDTSAASPVDEAWRRQSRYPYLKSKGRRTRHGDWLESDA